MGLLSTERDIRKPLWFGAAMSLYIREQTVIMTNSSYKEKVCFVYSGGIVHINNESSQSLGFTAGTRQG